MHSIQILLVAFAGFAALRTLMRFRHRGMGVTELFIWLGLWAGVAVFAIWPNLSQKLAGYLGVGRGVDAVMYIAVVTLSYALFRFYLRILLLDRQITTLVRELALRAEDRDKSSMT